MWIVKFFFFIVATAGTATKRLDMNAVGMVDGASIYEYDIDAGVDEKPWRKPGRLTQSYILLGR